MKNDGTLPRTKKAVENPGCRSLVAEMIAKHGQSPHIRRDKK